MNAHHVDEATSVMKFSKQFIHTQHSPVRGGGYPPFWLIFPSRNLHSGTSCMTECMQGNPRIHVYIGPPNFPGMSLAFHSLCAMLMLHTNRLSK